MYGYFKLKPVGRSKDEITTDLSYLHEFKAILSLKYNLGLASNSTESF